MGKAVGGYREGEDEVRPMANAIALWEGLGVEHGSRPRARAHFQATSVAQRY